MYTLLMRFAIESEGMLAESHPVYMFGSSREMVAANATHTQTTAKRVTPTVDETIDIERTRHTSSLDLIGHARLPLSF